MEIHYGSGRITIFPSDIVDEIQFDRTTIGTILQFDCEDGSMEQFEVTDKFVCLKVKRVKSASQTYSPEPVKKSWLDKFCVLLRRLFCF
jgi:hypothetical protein